MRRGRRTRRTRRTRGRVKRRGSRRWRGGDDAVQPPTGIMGIFSKIKKKLNQAVAPSGSVQAPTQTRGAIPDPDPVPDPVPDPDPPPAQS